MKFISLSFFLYFLISNLPAQVLQKEDLASIWLEAALQVESHIEQAKLKTEFGSTWRVMPDSITSQGDFSLYSGSPGIILFYLELYHVTKDPRFISKARSGAEYLIQLSKDSIFRTEECGLYTGLAGLGYTFLELYESTSDKRYLESVEQVILRLQNLSEKTSSGIHWGALSDVIYGSAGIGLFLERAYEKGIKSSGQISDQVALGLIDLAIIEHGRSRWKFTPSYSRYMDNFSHGTAGVAYYLCRVYRRTKDERFLRMAIKAGNLLSDLSNDQGYVPHHFPEGEELFYLSWCHGPAGTNKLYYELYDLTGQPKWIELINIAAVSVKEEQLDRRNTPGFWNNMGKCCGLTSIAEYFFWRHEMTNRAIDLEYAKKLTDTLLQKASVSGNGIKWVHAENRVSPDVVAAQTGLMQGSAGIGLWLLQLHLANFELPSSLEFPDDRKVVSLNTD